MKPARNISSHVRKTYLKKQDGPLGDATHKPSKRVKLQKSVKGLMKHNTATTFRSTTPATKSFKRGGPMNMKKTLTQ